MILMSGVWATLALLKSFNFKLFELLNQQVDWGLMAILLEHVIWICIAKT